MNTAERGFEKGRNRGPEYSVLKEMGGHVLFGFHRLAINGMDTISNQPISVQNVHLICNGEIYNFIDLRKELIARGYAFKSHSDTEVILAAYCEWGTQCLKRFNGTFAFALFDARQQVMFLARDRAGEND